MHRHLNGHLLLGEKEFPPHQLPAQFPQSDDEYQNRDRYVNQALEKDSTENRIKVITINTIINNGSNLQLRSIPWSVLSALFKILCASFLGAKYLENFLHHIINSLRDVTQQTMLQDTFRSARHCWQEYKRKHLLLEERANLSLL